MVHELEIVRKVPVERRGCGIESRLDARGLVGVVLWVVNNERLCEYSAENLGEDKWKSEEAQRERIQEWEGRREKG
jgi:hypothetical protein